LTPQFRGACQHEEIKMAKKQKTESTTTEPTTLATLSDRYLEQMEKDGKSVGTCFSYAMELKTAQNELGADTIVGTLTAADIERFNASDRVMKLKSGAPKAAPSYLKTQRVLRLALAFAEQTGLIAKSPIPAKAEKVDAPAPEPPAPKATKKKVAEIAADNPLAGAGAASTDPMKAAGKKKRRAALVEVVNEPQAEPAA
jgi:hypothetical protein